MANRLLVYQALWAMDRLVAPEASVADKFDRVRAAGFDGMAIDLGALSMEQAEATVPHFSRTGLAGGLTAFPTSVEALRPALRLAHRIAAPFVVVIGQEMPIALPDMLPVIEGWLRVAEQESMPIQFETHRNCITNDLFTTVQLIDAIPAMRLAADLSHYVVDREMPCPPPALMQELIAKILDRSDSFQGRVAARGQIQVALDFPQNAKWVALFRELVAAGNGGLVRAAQGREFRAGVPVRTRAARLCHHGCSRPGVVGSMGGGRSIGAMGARDLERGDPRIDAAWKCPFSDKETQVLPTGLATRAA